MKGGFILFSEGQFYEFLVLLLSATRALEPTHEQIVLSCLLISNCAARRSDQLIPSPRCKLLCMILLPRIHVFELETLALSKNDGSVSVSSMIAHTIHEKIVYLRVR